MKKNLYMLSNFFSKITATISFHDLVLSGLAVGITYCPAMVTSIESKMTEPASYAKLRPHKSIQFPFQHSFDFKQAKKPYGPFGLRERKGE